MKQKGIAYWKCEFLAVETLITKETMVAGEWNISFSSHLEISSSTPCISFP